MSAKKGVRQYPAEVRERAVPMVFEHEADYPSQWMRAIESIAGQMGLHHETLRPCVSASVGHRPTPASDRA